MQATRKPKCEIIVVVQEGIVIDVFSSDNDVSVDVLDLDVSEPSEAADKVYKDYKRISARLEQAEPEKQDRLFRVW